MNKDELFEIFKNMFPEWAIGVSSYRKIGSRCLAIVYKSFNDDGSEKESSRVFLYIDANNWQFGTKLWRKRPERLVKKLESIEKEDVQNEE